MPQIVLREYYCDQQGSPSVLGIPETHGRQFWGRHWNGVDFSALRVDWSRPVDSFGGVVVTERFGRVHADNYKEEWIPVVCKICGGTVRRRDLQ